MTEIRTILAPVDGSENSQRALAYAAYLAKQCGASLSVLHVVNLTATVSSIHQIGGGYVPDSVLNNIQEAGRSILEDALKQLPPGIEATVHLEIGSPTISVVSFCTDHKYDLVVMGSRGLGTLGQLVLGSISNYVLHHAPCPVMVVK